MQELNLVYGLYGCQFMAPIYTSLNIWSLQATTPSTVFSVIYYSELHSAITIY